MITTAWFLRSLFVFLWLACVDSRKIFRPSATSTVRHRPVRNTSVPIAWYRANGWHRMSEWIGAPPPINTSTGVSAATNRSQPDVPLP